MDVNKLADLIEHQLLPGLRVESTDPYEPVKVYMLPEPWRVAGTGNYAVVVAHPYYPDWVVKIYAPGRSGWYKEKAVYQGLGQHPSFSWCPYASDPYLILKRMKGQTLYDCIKRGIRIPERVILDIDEALEYARSRGLVPQDLHAKNVMMDRGRGKVLDVSDFLEPSTCKMWDDFKLSYYKLYKPFMPRKPLPIPEAILNSVRKIYRKVRKTQGIKGKQLDR
jgi:hypothetical protein